MKKWVLLWMLCAGLTAQGQVAFDVDYGALQKRVCRLCDKEQSPERRALVQDLKKDYTIIMVTHNMQQATRVSDKTAFFLLGEVIEYDSTEQIFSMPHDKRTEDYITGRFG